MLVVVAGLAAHAEDIKKVMKLKLLLLKKIKVCQRACGRPAVVRSVQTRSRSNNEGVYVAVKPTGCVQAMGGRTA